MYEYHGWPFRSEVPNFYLYCRTRIAVDPLEEAAALASALGSSVELLGYRKVQTAWENGLAFRFGDERPIARVARALQNVLDVETWVLHDDQNGVAEDSFGPASHFFGTPGPAIGARSRIVQVFIGNHGRDKVPEQALDRVKNLIPGLKPVLHFRDGRVLLVRTDQTLRMLTNRLERETNTLSKRLRFLFVCDQEQSLDLTGKPADCWNDIDFAYMSRASAIL